MSELLPSFTSGTAPNGSAVAWNCRNVFVGWVSITVTVNVNDAPGARSIGSGLPGLLAQNTNPHATPGSDGTTDVITPSPMTENCIAHVVGLSGTGSVPTFVTVTV